MQPTVEGKIGEGENRWSEVRGNSIPKPSGVIPAVSAAVLMALQQSNGKIVASCFDKAQRNVVLSVIVGRMCSFVKELSKFLENSRISEVKSSNKNVVTREITIVVMFRKGFFTS